MAKHEKETAMTKAPPAAVQTYDYGDDAVELGKGPAKGFENQTNADAAMPFLKIAEFLTPEVKEGKAKAGQIINTVTGEVLDEVFLVIGTTRHSIALFTPRDKGGGFQGQLEIDDPAWAKAQKEQKFGEYVDANGSEMVETFYTFGVEVDGETLAVKSPVMRAHNSTHIKVYKNWISQIRSYTQDVGGRKVCPPLYAHLVKMTTKLVEKKGNSWHIPVYTPANGTIPNSMIPQTSEAYRAAKVCGMLVDSGQAKVDYGQQERTAAPTTDVF